MAAIAFNHYNLRAPRELVDRLRDFYCNIIGLRQGRRPGLGSFGYWLYAGNDCVLHLSEARADELRLTHTSTTFDHVAFTCVDRLGMEVLLDQHNIRFSRGQVAELGIHQLFLQDPAGNGVELSFSQSWQGQHQESVSSAEGMS
jgi:glyoxylase I family protein